MIRVASYCRVSTNKDDQANSFESQQRFFENYIQHQSDWELYSVYADEGITGTNTRNRIQFKRMIQDAREGKFQLIITKEVSRFSRNILDTISYSRELKQMGIGIRFVLDGIDTTKPDAELYLSIMASLAQEESRKTSARVVWGQTRQMEKGVVFGQSLLGYDVKDGRITVNPEGAEIVRLIFYKYAVEQIATSEISKFLNQEGYCTCRGSTKWRPNTLIRILNNEKYVGDLIQKKSYTPDYLTHEKRKNKGAVPLISIKNHHEPIISREVWNLAQERLRLNNTHHDLDSGHSNRYVFSGKIKCGECGATFVGRFKYLKDGTKIRRWSCARTVRDGASACSIGKLVRDDDAMQMLKTALKNLSIDTNAIVSNVTCLALEAIRTDENGIRDNLDRLRLELSKVQQKKEAAMDSYFSQEISKEEMLAMKEKYENQISFLYQRLTETDRRQKENSNFQAEIASVVASVLTGETESDVFYKTILHSLTVFKDRHMELRLNHLTQVFRFTE